MPRTRRSRSRSVAAGTRVPATCDMHNAPWQQQMDLRANRRQTCAALRAPPAIPHTRPRRAACDCEAHDRTRAGRRPASMRHLSAHGGAVGTSKRAPSARSAWLRMLEICMNRAAAHVVRMLHALCTHVAHLWYECCTRVASMWHTHARVASMWHAHTRVASMWHAHTHAARMLHAHTRVASMWHRSGCTPLYDGLYMMHPACCQRCMPHIAHCVAHPACCDTLHVGRCEGRLHATPVVHPARSSKPGSSQDSERARPGDALHSRVATACCPKPCASPSHALPWPGPTCAIAAASQCAAETLLDPRDESGGGSGGGNTFVATLQHAR